jgi:hypothetical protein
MNIKVQMPGKVTAAALIESGTDYTGKCLTFHAFSKEMKARVLEQIALGAPILVSETFEKPRTGEWMEFTGEFKS